MRLTVVLLLFARGCVSKVGSPRNTQRSHLRHSWTKPTYDRFDTMVRCTLP